jgi:hypothetical protein
MSIHHGVIEIVKGRSLIESHSVVERGTVVEWYALIVRALRQWV